VSYLADTDVVVSFLNGRTRERDILSRLRPDGLAISLPTYGEIYEGIFFGRDPAQQEDVFLRFLVGVEVLLLDVEIMKHFARVKGELRSVGQLIPDMDLLIAATALEYDLTLVTRNLSHFTRISSLTIYQGS
jgi:predicted nucleic acid-binding protein